MVRWAAARGESSMAGDRFDELSKGLATAGTRRTFLRMLTAGLAGLTVAGFRRGRALADGGNSTCAKWCHENFSGSAAGHCTAEAARGGGPCHTCGPEAPPASQ